jgi:hypothetical protein
MMSVRCAHSDFKAKLLKKAQKNVKFISTCFTQVATGYRDIPKGQAPVVSGQILTIKWCSRLPCRA